MARLAVSRGVDGRMVREASRQASLRNVVIFTVMVLGSGWIGHGVDVLMGNTGTDTLGMAIWLVVPLPLSLILRAFGGDGWKNLGIRPHLRGNLAWYALALLVYPVATALILAAGGASGLIQF